MNTEAFAVALLAIADFALIAHLHRRRARRVRMARMMASLRMAVRRANGLEPPPKRRLVLVGQLTARPAAQPFLGRRTANIPQSWDSRRKSLQVPGVSDV